MRQKHIDPNKLVEGSYIICESEAEYAECTNELDRLGYTFPKGDRLTRENHWDDRVYDSIAYYIKDIHLRHVQYNTADRHPGGYGNEYSYQDITDDRILWTEISYQDQRNIESIIHRAIDADEVLISEDPVILRLLLDGAIKVGYMVDTGYDEYDYTDIIDLTNIHALQFDPDQRVRTYYCFTDANERYGTSERIITWDTIHVGDLLRTKKKEKESNTMIPVKQSIKKEKEKKNMNMFGNLNMEFGMNTDERIRSTFMGIAVQHEGTWKIYDKSAKTLTDIGDLNVGTLPLFVMPATKLEEGDLIKKDDSYYYVVESTDNKIRTISATTGKMEAAVPTDNILGIRFYSKIVAIAEDLISDISGDDSTDKLMMAMAMSSMSGETDEYGDGNTSQMNQMLLPLLLLKDKKTDSKEGDTEGGDKKSDTLKKFMLMSMMTGNNGAGNQNAMLPLLLMKGDLF